MFDVIKEIVFAVGGWVLSDKLRDPGSKLEAVKDEMLALSRKYNDDSERVKAGIIQLDAAIQEQKGDLERIQKAIGALESDVRGLRKLATRRLYWGYGVGALGAIALVLAIVALAR